MLYVKYIIVSFAFYATKCLFFFLRMFYLMLRFFFMLIVPSMQKIIWMLEQFLFICFFIWEIAELKKHRHSIFFIVYMISIILLWSIFYIFMFRWFVGVYNTYYAGEQLLYTLLFIWLAIFYFLFSEARRFLRHFLEDFIIYDEDWEWEEDDDNIYDITPVVEHFKQFVTENKHTIINEKS